MSCGCKRQYGCQTQCGCSLFKTVAPGGSLHVVKMIGDRFVPFQLTVRLGDSVKFINTNVGGDHTVTASPGNLIGPALDKVVAPQNGTFTQRFCDNGLWVYYSKFQATIDKFDQPIAPGPGDGELAEPTGLQGFGDVTVSPMDNSTAVICSEDCVNEESTLCCNYGTPMMGVICVLPRIIC